MIILFLIILVVFIILIGVTMLWAGGLSGGITIDWGNGEALILNAGYSILLVIAVALLSAAAVWLLVSLFSSPWRFGRARRNSRVKKANRALADGLLAAEAGDVNTAKKLSKKAAQHAEDDRLKLLLEARAAEISDDWSGAERAWGQLARLPGGQLAGLRGAA
ncbi:MAG: heme biosynthesis HemY N-terminal domain-containing protein, partial [Pseudomonadota bacterium]